MSQTELLELLNNIAAPLGGLAGITALLNSLYYIYKKEKLKRFLSKDEMDFILSRGDAEDQLNEDLSLIKRKTINK